MLILHDLTPLPWWLAGAAVGAITLLLLWVTNQRFGISTGYENLCALAGVLVGASLFGVLYERVGALLRLPKLELGTGDG